MLTFDNTKLHLRTGGLLHLNAELEVEQGLICVVTGENGAGKTVTLGALAAALGATQQSIVTRVDGTVIGIDALDKRVAIVRQDPLDNFIARAASDELAMPLLNDGVSIDQATQLVQRLLRELDLQLDLLNKPVVALSGGERQLFALAVASATRPSVLLLDEPLARLDDSNSRRVLRAIDALREHTTIIIASHDGSLLRRFFGDRLRTHEVTCDGTHIQVFPVESSQPGIAHEDEPPRQTPEMISGTGDVCLEICPGDLSVFHISNKTPLTSSTDMTVTTGTNLLFGDNGSGKTLLARCLAGHTAVNSWVTDVLSAAIGDLFGLLSGLFGRGTLSSVLPARLNHHLDAPPTSFARYRRLGHTAFRPPEPSVFLSESTVRQELCRFLSENEVDTRLDYLIQRGIAHDDSLSELSFGQRKLVTLSTIPEDARLVVLDEPLSGLSEKNRIELMRFLDQLRSLDKCFVFTTNKTKDREFLQAGHA